MQYRPDCLILSEFYLINVFLAYLSHIFFINYCVTLLERLRAFLHLKG